MGAISFEGTASTSKQQHEIAKNAFSGFHGAINTPNLDNLSITGNELTRNSFTNILASGKNLLIQHNEVLYPGDGTTGDGITILGDISNSSIRDNTIFAGSCYGILIKGGTATHLEITQNKVLNGITSAIQVEGNKQENRNISISHNVIIGNYGFAVALIDTNDVDVTSNHIVKNARSFPSQIYIENSSRIAIDGNLNSKELSPEWSKSLALYRSHVFSDNNVFTLPQLPAMASDSLAISPTASP